MDDWLRLIRETSAPFEEWINGLSEMEWNRPVEGTWTAKDLVGHLAVWSDFLMDQITALSQERPELIKAIDIDSWNAAQIKARRGWSSQETQKEWGAAMNRVQALVASLPKELFARRWTVAWTAKPITINDLLDLWLFHFDQHQNVWKSPTTHI